MAEKFELTEQHYRYLFENASDAMWVQDIEGNIVDVNKACEKLTGYTGKELTGMKVTRLLTAEYLDSAREVKRKLLEGETIEQPYEQRLIRKDNTTGIVKMATSLVVIGGQAKGFQNIARDVTQEKEMQENLRFYVQQITRAQEDERKRIARQLHDEVAPPVLLVIQSLDSVASLTRPRISKAIAGKLEELRAQAIEALQGVRRCAQDLRPSILDDLGLLAALEWMADDLVKKWNIDAHVEVTGNQVDLSNEVQLLLFRIAQEALSNVRRHSQASAAKVKLEFGDSRITLAVTDNGPGIPAASRERVFQPFFTTKRSGTGLGLALVQKIIVFHNGRIVATASPVGGASLQITLPLAS